MAEKLSNDKIQEISQLSSSGKSQWEIWEILGVSRATVNRYLVKLKQWVSNEIVNEFSKDDIKKLELIKDLSPKQIEEILYQNIIAKRTDKVNIQTEQVWHALFWAIGDTHQWSKAHNNEWLHKYYDIVKDRWIKTVLHAWDLVDWYNVYKWHTFELTHHWSDKQAKEVIDNYPKRDWVDTYFICGNHDESLLQLAWYDIGKTIDMLREDMHYLGFYNARVMLNGVDVEIQHWGWSNSYAWCFDDKTEILTQDWRKFFKELTSTDFVATLNPETHDFERQLPTDYVNDTYKGTMYHFNSRTIDLLVTPEHRMYMQRYIWQQHIRNEELTYPSKSHKTVNWDFDFITADELYNYKWNIRQRWNYLKVNNKYKWTNLDIPEYIDIEELPYKKYQNKKNTISKISFNDLVSFVWRYVTEWSSTKYATHIHQYKDVNPDKRESIKELCISIWWDFVKYDNKKITIYSWNFTKFINDLCWKWYKNKRVPWFIKELPHEYLDILFKNMIDWDWNAHERWYWYTSASRWLADDLSEIAQKLWYAVTSYFAPKDWTNWCYKLSIYDTQIKPTINKRPDVIDYNWTINCVTVDNWIILVRRNWKSVWSGNSYKPQKYLENADPKNQPNVFLLWHYHTALYMFYRKIHTFMVWAFQWETNLTKRFKLGNTQGWWIVEVFLDSDWWTKINMEFIKV